MTDYGAKHRWLRLRWKRRIRANGGRITCWRCRRTIESAQPWDLGHYDGTDMIAGPEHVSCNRATAGRFRT